MLIVDHRSIRRDRPTASAPAAEPVGVVVAARCGGSAPGGSRIVFVPRQRP